MRRRVDQEDSFVLHSYAYRETSLIVEAFARHYGRVALIARGARRPRSALRGMLLAFQPLRLGWSGTGELATLMRAEWRGGIGSLAGSGLMCGFYLNELLLRLMPRDDPHEALFDRYAESIARLARGDSQGAVLRAFERRMLGDLGYAPLLERDAASGAPIEGERYYRYEPDHGPVAVSGIAMQPGSQPLVIGQTLLDMAHDDYTSARTRDEARSLLRALIAYRLGDRALNTRAVLKGLQDL